jgi:hypothetical protein
LGSSQTSTQRADPWAPSQPYLIGGMNDAFNLYQQGGFSVNPYVNRNPGVNIPYGQNITPMGTPATPTAPTTTPTTPVTGGRNDPNSGNYDPGSWDFAGPAGASVAENPFAAAQNDRTRDPTNNRDRELRSLAGPNDALRGGRRGIITNARNQADIMSGVQGTVGGIMNGPTGQGANADMFNRENRQAANLGRTDAFSDAIRGGRNAGVMSQFSNEVDNVRGLGRTDAFREGINNAVRGDTYTDALNRVTAQQSRADIPGQVNRAVNTALDQGNATEFDRAVGDATRTGQDQALRARLQKNVLADVMPAINSSFAGSGMTGSGLHQQNLAKGAAAGLAGVEQEIINRAQDRALQAGGMAQGALEANRNRAISAGGLGLNADNSIAGRQMQAAGMRQGAYENSLDRGLAAGQMNQADALQRAQMGLSAAGMEQDARNTALGINMQAGNMAQQDTINRAQLGMQAGNNMQGARESAIARQLQAAGLQAGLSGQSGNPYAQIAGVGEARQGDTQARYDDAIRRNTAAQEEPIRAIQNYMNMISGLGGQFASQQGTTRNNPGLLGILGALF